MGARRINIVYQIAVLCLLLLICSKLYFSLSSPNNESYPEVIVYTFRDNSWKRNTTVCQKDVIDHLKSKHYFRKNYLKSWFGKIPLYINDPKEDAFSKDIAASHMWEPWGINTIYKYLRKVPSATFVDIGANLGSITLPLAMLGWKVVAIEPVYQNVQHLCASIIENRLQDKVTIVHNALSNNNEDVPFKMPEKGQFMLGFVDQSNKKMVSEMSGLFGKFYKDKTVPIKATTLNELLTFGGFDKTSKIFIKIDSQGFEKPIFEGADDFFKTMHVMWIFIEWTYHWNKPSGDFLAGKFRSWKFSEPLYCNDVLKDIYADLDQPCDKINITHKSKPVMDDVIWLRKLF